MSQKPVRVKLVVSEIGDQECWEYKDHTVPEALALLALDLKDYGMEPFRIEIEVGYE